MQSYWKLSKTHRYSVLFALPLLGLYEGLAAALSHGGSGVRNGADVILKAPFILVAGARGQALFGVCLVLGSVFIVSRDVRAHGARFRPAIFGGMMLEAVALAFVFGVAVGLATARLLGAFGGLAIGPMQGLGWWAQLMVSLGAGLYEELLFRVILVGALAFAGRRLLGWRAGAAGVVAASVGALVFSAFHYVGPYGDPLRVQSFVFRAIAGLCFSALYLLRGFGITAWTHALYDVMLLVI